VSVPELMATVLGQLGIDHYMLAYPFHGIMETPTDAKVNGAAVVEKLLSK